MTIDAYKTRIQMYERFPKDAVGAECGVWLADNAVNLVNVAEPKLMYCVDPYAQPKLGDKSFNIARNLLLGFDCVKFIRQWDWDWFDTVEDDHLDWVYIDTLHTDDSTRRELAGVLPKVKKGGIIAGHDFCITPKWGIGVIGPVIEQIQSGTIELIAIATEQPFPSFMCRKV